MDDIDIQQQWRQLQETYSLMSEDELSTIAQDAYDLTPTAQEALQAVIRERGSKIQLNIQPPAVPVDSSEDSDLESFSWVMTREEAKKTKNTLDSAGIPSYVGPDNVMDLEEFKGSFERGIEIKVRSIDRQRARAACAHAAQMEDDGTPDPDEGKEFAVLCPKCRSAEVVFQSSDPGTTGSPLETKFNWQCPDCSYEWKDDGIEQEV